MNHNWNYRDCIDLEYFIERDRELKDSQLHERDRTIFLELPESQKKEPLAAWLQHRRAAQKEILPGQLAKESFSLLRLLLLPFFLCSGIAGGLAYFSYSGDTPVNVLPFFTLFVVLQVLLVLATLLRHIISRLIWKRMPRSALQHLVALISSKLVNLLLSRTSFNPSGSRRQLIQTLLGRCRTYSSRYAHLFLRHIFILLQLTGICFNTGLLAASFGKILVSDVAFGWQSTLQLSAESLHTAVRVVALPWAWLFGEGSGYPSLPEIEGSRIILKEGISSLATENLISWWPFLLLSVAVYCLGPRLLLTACGVISLRCSERAFHPDSPGARAIIRRMQTPLVTTQAKEEPAHKAPHSYNSSQCEETEKNVNTLRAEVLFPDDIFDYIDRDLLEYELGLRGFSIADIHRFQRDYQSDMQLLALIGKKTPPPDTVIVTMEAWMPPLTALLSYLKELRLALPPATLIMIWLIGKSDSESPFNPVDNLKHEKIWRDKISGLGDPYVDVIVLERNI